MKFAALLPALLQCLSLVTATPSSSDSTQISKISLPSTFTPPQVFKNANLVHIVSLEKNYAKEIINTKIENIAKEPQDEYFIPFSPDQMSRIGGLEVKDKKNTEAGVFQVEAVEFDPARWVTRPLCSDHFRTLVKTFTDRLDANTFQPRPVLPNQIS